MSHWQIKKPSSEKIARLSQDGLSDLMATLLVNRGLEAQEDVRHYLFDTLADLPSPFLLQDCQRAVDRVIHAIHQNQKIVIYGDYDVDGTCATALLLTFFQEIGAQASFYIPHRMKEGYSLHTQALEKLKSEGCDLLITVDNGIAATAEVDFASSIGLDIIITDHHEVPAVLPKALAILNPLQQGCLYPHKTICGSGVAFNLMMALRSCLRKEGYFSERPEPNLKRYLDLVAIATVADVVPLKGANRIFVKYGLEEVRHTQRPGLVSLKKVAGIEGEVSSSHLGFRLGPRLNACGRLYDASMGVRLLMTQNLLEAERLAAELDAANKERQLIEEEILQGACQQVLSTEKYQERRSYVLFNDAWHPGVVGIVASRIVARFHRPTLVLGRDKEVIKGSARSWGGLNIVEALRACQDLLLKCGGHKAAAGLTLRPENLEAFQLRFEEEVRKRLTEEECQPKLNIDFELTTDQISKKLIEDLKQLEPYGQGNPEPVFSLKSVKAQSLKLVGDSHLKFQIPSSQGPLDAIAFRMADRKDSFSKEGDIAFSCELNQFRGVEKIQLTIKEVRFVAEG